MSHDRDADPVGNDQAMTDLDAAFAALRAVLEQHADRPLKIGSFSAASNVTGIITEKGIARASEDELLAFWPRERQSKAYLT